MKQVAGCRVQGARDVIKAGKPFPPIIIKAGKPFPQKERRPKC